MKLFAGLLLLLFSCLQSCGKLLFLLQCVITDGARKLECEFSALPMTLWWCIQARHLFFPVGKASQLKPFPAPKEGFVSKAQ